MLFSAGRQECDSEGKLAVKSHEHTNLPRLSELCTDLHRIPESQRRMEVCSLSFSLPLTGYLGTDFMTPSVFIR